MYQICRRNWLVYVALVIWLFASSSGMHGHYCLDGLEPPVSVHFDVLNGHVDTDLTGHTDVDSKPGQLDVLKLSNSDFAFLSALIFFIFVWPIIRNQKYRISNTPLAWSAVSELHPPLRAPPVSLR